MIPFTAFPKIPRLRRRIVITEKIDGTNANVTITNDGLVLAGSRNRWITPEDDNYGFARWVRDHEEELRVGLGPGTHFGEWWGGGIQRGYGLTAKRFSLFNTARWGLMRPVCCGVVPVLYDGVMDQLAIDITLHNLDRRGSVAAPGFMRPEGIVVFHTASNDMFKVLLENDDQPKGAQR